MLDGVYPNGDGDGDGDGDGAGGSASSRARHSRQQTKDRITELFLIGNTQSNALGSKWAAVNAIIEHGDRLCPPHSNSQRLA